MKTLFGCVSAISLICIVFYGMNNLPSTARCPTVERKITSTRNLQFERADILSAGERKADQTEYRFVNISSQPENLPSLKSQKPPKHQKKQTCSPTNHVLFLKTHKTGSSTITNILNRYGDKKKLDFCATEAEAAFHILVASKISRLLQCTFVQFWGKYSLQSREV